MRKHYLILPLILSLFSILFAGAPDTLWTRTYGGDMSDVANSIQQLDDSGFIIAGNTNSFGILERDVYLLKTNFVGDTIWTKTFGGSGWQEGLSVLETTDGGFFITGNNSRLGNLDIDIYLVRTDVKGDTLFVTCESPVRSKVIAALEKTGLK